MALPVLTAAVTGRQIDLAQLYVPAVVLCYAEAAQGEAEPIEAAVRERFPDPKAVVVVHVIDLRSVPAMFRSVAEGIMRGEVERAIRELPDGRDAFDEVIVAPDWDGSFIRGAGLTDVSKQLGAAVFLSGALAGTAQGEGVAAEVLRLLEGGKSPG